MNPENLRALWDENSRPVYAYLLRLTKCPEEASDLLQDLFARLARQPELVARLNGDARGYLMRLARNSVIDQVRRAQVRDRIFEKINAARAGETIPASDPDQTLIRRAIEQALRALPADQRHVVIERLWKKRTLDEIAVENGLSINTVASRYRYGVDKLREALRSLYEDLATGSAANPSKTMKMKPTQTNALPETETPIIQPLEPRRVPSATGAAFALPMPPVDEADAAAGVPVEEISIEPIADELPLDAEVELAVEDFVTFEKDLSVDFTGEEGEIPVSFEDILISQPGEVEFSDEEIGDMIFWSFGGPLGVAEEGVTVIEEGEIVDGEVIDEEFVEGEVVDGEVVEGEVGEGEVGEGEVVEILPDKDIDPNAITDGSDNGSVVPLDWIKRGDQSEVTEVEDPNVIFYTTGSPVVLESSAAGNDGPAPEALGTDKAEVDHSADPRVTNQVTAPASTTATTLGSAATASPETTVEAPVGATTTIFSAVPAGGASTGWTVDLGGVAPAGLASSDAADVPALAPASFTGAPDLASTEIAWQATEIAADEVVAGEHWVPLPATAGMASALVGDLTAATPAGDLAATVPVTDAVAGAIPSTTPASGAAMAATGAILAGSSTPRDSRKKAE